MTVKEVVIRATISKKTDIKRVIICKCDNCGSEFERRFKQKSLEKYSKICFCSRECQRQSQCKGGILHDIIQETCIKKYGVSNVSKSDISKQHSKSSRLGLRLPVRLERKSQPKKAKIFRPRLDSKRMSSKREDEFAFILTEAYPDTQRHVRVHRWLIDFYIPSIDTYVNFNGVYWHGRYKTDEELSNSIWKQSKTILETKRRDRDRETWFIEQGKTLCVVWEDDFLARSTDQQVSDMFCGK